MVVIAKTSKRTEKQLIKIREQQADICDLEAVGITGDDRTAPFFYPSNPPLRQGGKASAVHSGKQDLQKNNANLRLEIDRMIRQ